MRIIRPVNQVRLTNVAIVRLKRHGHRFEIACYKNKILNWKSGIEKNLDEVLQIKAVFHNVSKGEYAKKEFIQKAFDTEDIETVVKIILEKGQLQVSEKERESVAEQIFKDICNLVCLFTVNPTTGLPLTLSMIEGEIRNLGYSVQIDQSPKKQALKLVELMENKLPDQIARVLMKLRISCTPEQENKLKQFLIADCFAVIEKEDFFDGNIKKKCDRKIPLVLRDHQAININELNKTTTQTTAQNSSTISSSDNTQGGPFNNMPAKEESEIGEDQIDELLRNPIDKSLAAEVPGGDHLPFKIVESQAISSFSVVIRCSPKYYRSIDEFIMKILNPPGSLQLITSNIKNTNSKDSSLDVLPDSNSVSHLERIFQEKMTNLFCDEPTTENINATSVDVMNTDDPTNPSNDQKSTQNLLQCGTCLDSFTESEVYRIHCKSPRHNVNLQRKLENLQPLSEAEYFVFLTQSTAENPTKSKSHRKKNNRGR